MRALTWLGQTVLDLLYPPHCVLCRRGGAFLCEQCADALPRAAAPRCARCWLPDHVESHLCPLWGSDLDFVRAPYLHEAGARELVHRLKYEGISVLAGPMGELLAGFAREQALAADIVAPVPLHPWRERARGYNQAAMLARAVAAGIGAELRPVLRRRRATASQVHQRTAAERAKNVDGAFAVRQPVPGLTVLLVDDVVTTGATLAACARALQETGAARILGLTFTRQQ
jgi:ComF family protein